MRFPRSEVIPSSFNVQLERPVDGSFFRILTANQVTRSSMLEVPQRMLLAKQSSQSGLGPDQKTRATVERQNRDGSIHFG